MIRSVFYLAILISIPAVVFAQEKAPDLSGFSPETQRSFTETQDFIDRTQKRINSARSQTDARANEIEALANRVSDILSKMSSQGEDNSALQSEISVLSELLKLERATTADLRIEIIQLTETQAAQKIKQEKLTQAHTKEMDKKQVQILQLQRQLKTIISQRETQEKTNKVLLSNIEKLTTETERLNKQVKILKENRYRPKRRSAVTPQ